MDSDGTAVEAAPDGDAAPVRAAGAVPAQAAEAAPAQAAEAAPAKVNLFLHVTGRRADGYHLLDSLAVFAGIGDLLLAAPSDALGLALEGPEAGALSGEGDNLVLRAARVLAAAAGVEPGAAMVLRKRLPVASGIGGGSADAAAALRLLGRLWGASLPPGRVAALALSLGADVPACLLSRPVRMGGVGEVLTAAPPLPPLGMVLANPRIAVPTPAVFAARAASGAGWTAPAALPARGWADAAALAAWLEGTRNDLEAPATSLCPPVAEVIAALRGAPRCLLARMSGSGATCFGLFPDPAAAAAAAAALPRAWWRWGGGLHVAPG